MRTRTIIMLIVWILIAFIALIGLFYLTFFTGTTYYTQIDNACVVEITPRGGMNYRYELPAYDEQGRARLLSFETARLLREEAYLQVEVAPIRGVTEWQEVQLEDMPGGASAMFAIAAE